MSSRLKRKAEAKRKLLSKTLPTRFLHRQKNRLAKLQQRYRTLYQQLAVAGGSNARKARMLTMMKKISERVIKLKGD